MWKERVENRLRELLKGAGPELLREAMSYYPLQEGKRIRPLFTVAVAHALGGDEEDAITVGCAIEMVHNYSLIHDDLPAMDDDELRRGLPACHVKYGEAIAVLAGDALLTYAFEVLSNESLYRSLKGSRLLKILNTVARKSGVEGMVGGQALDITSAGNPHEISLKKTAALFQACFMCGGILSDREDLLPILEKIGEFVGLLFQITDDILDRDGYWEVFGAEVSMRKVKELHAQVTRLLPSAFGKPPPELIYLIEKIRDRIT